MDNSSVLPTMPRRTAYLYCSDGTNYYRLGYAQNGVSEIGPWLETVNNTYQTTFRNGMDFGLSPGSMIFLMVKNAMGTTLWHRATWSRMSTLCSSTTAITGNY